MNKVTDLQAFIKRKAEEQENADEELIALPEYGAHASQLTLDLNTKIDMAIVMLRTGWLENNDTKAMDILKMAHLSKDILHGVVFPFMMVTGTTARYSNVEDAREVQFYIFAAGMDRYSHATDNNEPLAIEFQMQIALWEIEPEDMTGEVRVPLERISMPVLPDALLRSEQIYQVLQNLDNLVRVNGGTTMLRDNGKYLAVMPHSPRYTLSIAVVGDLPFEYV